MITAMAGIPPTRDGDSEDVVWALQTAEALWKRDERRDALVWLRRAAQAASDAEDDERALGLAREAAELADWDARRSAFPPVAPRVASPPSPLVDATGAPLRERSAYSTVDDAPELDLGAVEEVSAELIIPDDPDAIPATDRRAPFGDAHRDDPDDVHRVEDEDVTSPHVPASLWSAHADAPRPRLPIRLTSLVPTLRAPPRPTTLPPPSPSTRTLVPPMPSVSLASGPAAGGSMFPPARAAPAPGTAAHTPRPPSPGAPSEADASSARPAHVHVPTGAEAHAGMLDPWDQSARKLADVAPARVGPTPRRSSAPTRPPVEPDEVITSAPPVTTSAASPKGVARARGGVKDASSSPAPTPAPRPARDEPVVGAPNVPPFAVASLVSFAAARVVPFAAAPIAPRRSDTTGEGPSWFDGSAANAWPEQTRGALARSARVQDLARDDEVFGFALALVVEGDVDVAATIVDAPAERLEPGNVLRGRGTLDSAAPLRLIARTDRARVVTWREPQVADAFQTCPWLDNELRVAANRIQALVGVTLGPLGDRLDAALRAQITRRLALRWLVENEVFVHRGEPIPGLLVVGTGEIELSARLGAPGRTVLRSGEFLFASEVLQAAPAPSSVRGAKGGALVLVADRAVTQELLVTCPPLLEILAGV